MTFTFEVRDFRAGEVVGEIITKQVSCSLALQAARQIAEECWPETVRVAGHMYRTDYVRLVRVSDAD